MTLLARLKPELVFRCALTCFAGEPPGGCPADWRAATFERLASIYGTENVPAVLDATRAWLATDPKITCLLDLSAFGDRAEVVLPMCRAALEAAES